MLPAFFDSIVQLITKTSTDLPPDVRLTRRERDLIAEILAGQSNKAIAQALGPWAFAYSSA